MGVSLALEVGGRLRVQPLYWHVARPPVEHGNLQQARQDAWAPVASSVRMNSWRRRWIPWGLAVSLCPILAQAADAGLPVASCEQEGSRRISEVYAAAERDNADALKGELARRGLRIVTLGVQHQTLSQGTQSSYPLKARAPADGQYVQGDSFWTLSGSAIPAWTFVTNSAGDIFRLLPVAESARRTDLRMCGCQPRDCPSGSGCPGCGETLLTWYGPLPPRSRYRGELKVRYPFEGVEKTWEQGTCLEPCPPPPPSTPGPPPPRPRTRG